MNPGPILVVNAGSSNLKLSVVVNDQVAKGVTIEAPWPQGQDLADRLLEFGPVGAVGHRVVHGGPHHSGPARISAQLEQELESLIELAPLHQPPALAGMAAARLALPRTPQVACFDTAFHAQMPPAARTYALPAAWRRSWSVQRFGFHGLAHRYVAERSAELLGAPLAQLRLVTCQLGGGASLAAVKGGRSVDTTMGFTPLEGLVMATRSGSVDPGLVTWLIRAKGLSPTAVEEALERRSGVLAMAGTADMRQVVERASSGDPDCELALSVYVHHLAKGVAAMAASMGGLDAVAFSGGVGEGSAVVRARAVDQLEFLGLGLDPQPNQEGRGDRHVERPGSPPILVVAAREDLQIAREVRELLDGDSRRGASG